MRLSPAWELNALFGIDGEGVALLGEHFYPDTV